MDHLDYKMLKQMTIPTTCLDALFVFLPARATIKEMTKTMDVRKLLRMLAFKSGTKKQEIVFSSGETIGPFYEDFPGLKVKKVSDTGVEFELNEKRFSLTKVGETFVTYKIIVN
uniref:FTH domain-containing protein n=1 Tax=Caenorhabditis tropicalis TaxID=1561998 RepID=A0A1I7UP71_9PELO